MPQVRPATFGDAHAIAVVHVDAWRSAYRTLMPEATLAQLSVAERSKLWESDIENARLKVFVAESDGAIVGLMAIGESRDPDARLGTLEIAALYVSPACWSKGVGQALCAAAESFARSSGADRLMLWALTGNSRARRFYLASGFVEQPELVRPYVRHGLSLQQTLYVKPIVSRAPPA